MFLKIEWWQANKNWTYFFYQRNYAWIEKEKISWSEKIVWSQTFKNLEIYFTIPPNFSHFEPAPTISHDANDTRELVPMAIFTRLNARYSPHCLAIARIHLLDPKTEFINITNVGTIRIQDASWIRCVPVESGTDSVPWCESLFGRRCWTLTSKPQLLFSLRDLLVSEHRMIRWLLANKRANLSSRWLGTNLAE